MKISVSRPLSFDCDRSEEKWGNTIPRPSGLSVEDSFRKFIAHRCAFIEGKDAEMLGAH